MERRDIESIARGRPFPMPKRIKNIMIVLFVIFIGSAFMIISDDYSTAGIFIAIATWLGILANSYFWSKERDKMVKTFVEEYEKTGTLPPWPEESRASRQASN